MYVKSITLENIRGFKDLRFDFQRPGGKYAGWTVFLGGNASGKSTLLKSIAISITGPDVISDGCRSVYATVLDLVHGMFVVYGIEGLFAKDVSGKPVVTKPGVVFIDEIEAHLHPSWQREIPEWFKQHFPEVQFFVTTHSPR